MSPRLFFGYFLALTACASLAFSASGADDPALPAVPASLQPDSPYAASEYAAAGYAAAHNRARWPRPADHLHKAAAKPALMALAD